MTGKRTQEEVAAQRAQFNRASEGLLRLLLEDEPKEALIDRVVTLLKREKECPPDSLLLGAEWRRLHQNLHDVHQWAATPMAQVLIPVRGGEFEDVTVERAQLALTYATECLQRLVVMSPALIEQIGGYVGAMAAVLNVARGAREAGSDD